MRVCYILLMASVALLASSEGVSAVANKNVAEMTSTNRAQSINVQVDGKRFLRAHKVVNDDDDGGDDDIDDDDDDDDDKDDIDDDDDEERLSAAKLTKLMKPDETYLYQKMAQWKNQGYSPSTIWDKLDLHLKKNAQYKKIYEKYLGVLLPLPAVTIALPEDFSAARGSRKRPRDASHLPARRQIQMDALDKENQPPEASTMPQTSSLDALLTLLPQPGASGGHKRALLFFGESARKLFMLEQPDERRVRLVLALKKDPSDVEWWLELLRCPVPGCPSLYNRLRLVRRAITCIEEHKSRDDEGYTEIWLMLAKLHETEVDTRNVFVQMKDKKIGQKHAMLYEEEAVFEFNAGKGGNRDVAEDILERGVDNDALTPAEKENLLEKVVAGTAGWVKAFSGAPIEQKIRAHPRKKQVLQDIRTQDDRKVLSEKKTFKKDISFAQDTFLGLDERKVLNDRKALSDIKALDHVKENQHFSAQDTDRVSDDRKLPEASVRAIMEHGEIDLSKRLRNLKGAMDENLLRVIWTQMLQAVDAIHSERIIHGDLKPANFLFVNGALKLIDFGIAKAISNDTTNIERDSQVGTINFMSPEAIQGNTMPDGQRDPEGKMKVGRASDIWSLGCILYQIVYSKPPFADVHSIIEKFRCIIDPTVPIPFPALKNKDLEDVIRSCLQRDHRRRPTITGDCGLLNHPFLRSGGGNSGVSSTVAVTTTNAPQILTQLSDLLRSKGVADSRVNMFVSIGEEGLRNETPRTKRYLYNTQERRTDM
ncbi:hypothetical protein PHYBOEH_011248 [Phytophthora boehmeriae]|uniref:Protein kinase domain-containing protein n=1 Tax=Phytophthora boehmeriae TaxID=109152 RepID=A0A8T1X3V4_9STRA|nr:hypothetical protein PHYBOEH_011248 [Phytophthora boehmeriae]